MSDAITFVSTDEMQAIHERNMWMLDARNFMPEHTPKPDVIDAELYDAANVAIQRARALGIGKHGATKWQRDSDHEHITKALGHIIQHEQINAGYKPDDKEDHLAHALSRLAMVLAKRKLRVGTPCT